MNKKVLVAGLNILFLLVASILIGLNYYNNGIIYYFAVGDLDLTTQYFQDRSLVNQTIIVLLLVLVEVIIGFIPAIVMYPVIGLLIGAELGIVLIFIGNIIGNSVNYIQGKIIAKAFLSNQKYTKYISKLQDGGFWTLFLLRLNPITSFDSISYIAGALNMKFKSFLTATITGVAPLIILGTIIGEDLLIQFKFGLETLVIATLIYIFYTVWIYKKKKK